MNREMGFLCEARVSDIAISTYDPRGARHWGVSSRRKLVFGRLVGPDHDAVMRIGGEAPGGGAILSVGIRASSNHGFPPLGSSIRLRRKPARAPNSSGAMLVPANPFQPAGRNTTPSSVWPVVTKRQSAMSSLRASATIIVLRVPARRSAVRAWYHRASALSF